MRGKDGSACVYGDAEGITPAHAGKSHTFYRVKALREDHPRPCGEKAAPECTADAHIGSPPPMRGKAGPVRRLTLPPGITPAHAGKSFFLRLRQFGI